MPSLIPRNPTAPWIVHTISEKGPWQGHGIGVGDINGDKLPDILGADGWWEQPPKAVAINCGPTIRRPSDAGDGSFLEAPPWRSMTSTGTV